VILDDGLEIGVDMITVHPMYDAFHNDLAVVKLDRKIK
jgi:hypothetical protein